MNKYNVILRPVITEKTSGERADASKFVFEVSKDTNKIEIRKNFEQLFGVKPKSVNITKVVKKVRSRDGAVKRKVAKRAIVSVAKGTKVDLTVIK